MKSFKFVLAVAAFFACNAMTAQQVITISSDKVYEDTVVFTEDTILEGVGNPNVTFNGTPKFQIENCRVLIKNMKISDRSGWGGLRENAFLEWYGIGMRGFMTNTNLEYNTFLDGTPK